MYMFSKLFIESTDPLTNYKRLFNIDVIISICFHLGLYLLLLKLVTLVFKLNIPPIIYHNITIVLVPLMIIGYITRLARSKTLYKVYINRGYTSSHARQLSMQLLHSGYFTYYFLG